MARPLLYLYARHPVAAALRNPQRSVRQLFLDEARRSRLEPWLDEALAAHPNPPPFAWVSAKALTRRVGAEALHQGLVAEVRPLANPSLTSLLAGLGAGSRLALLDQVTDPHNVGAILRSAAVFGLDALLTPWRYSPEESGLLARVASGGLDTVPWLRLGNLAEALERLHQQGFVSWGLTGDAEPALDSLDAPARLAIVLGSEGAGLRAKTRATVSRAVRLPTAQAAIQDLNVSNAAAIAFYATRRAVP